MKTNKQFLVIILFFAFSNLWSQTHVSGIINTNTTWTVAGSPYVVDADVTVEQGVTLYIQPGVVVKFKDYRTSLSVNGKLIAIGTPQQKIVFTSLLDDAHGGDTNGDGSTTSPAPNQWAAIWLNNTGTDNQFDHCWFGYGGNWYTSAIINNLATNTRITNSTIGYSGERGVYSENTSLYFANNMIIGNATEGLYFKGFNSDKDVILTNNTFVDNVNWAVLSTATEDKLILNLTDNTSSGSAHNGFGINGHLVNSSSFLTEGDFPIIIYADLHIDEGADLTIASGSVIKFNDYTTSLIVNGHMTAIGTSTAPIVFTSLLDDAHGGDTNGDGVDTEPAGNQWAAIWLNKTGTGNQFDHCWFGYGGNWYTSAMINNLAINTRITNSTIGYSGERGVYSENTSPYFANNMIIGNATEGLYFNGFNSDKDVILTNNTFVDNVNWAALSTATEDKLILNLTGNSSSGSAHNGFGINGHLVNSSSFLTEGDFPIIIYADLHIDEGADLTIASGSVMKFNDYTTSLTVNGHLTAIGTSTAPIVFTSLLDDAHGGDTNGDGVDTEPAGNQWAAIWLNNTGTGNQFDHCWFGYGGNWYTSAIINNLATNTQITNSTIGYSGDRGVYSENTSPYFANNMIIGNATDGLYFNGFRSDEDVILTNNTFVDNINWAVLSTATEDKLILNLTGNTSSGSAHNGFGINGHLVNSSSFLTEGNFSIIIYADLHVDEGADLTIASGSVIKFNDYTTSLIVNGHLTAIGTSPSPIVFTSLLDDVHGGDTNGDGSDTEPVGNQWAAIWLNNAGSGNQFDHCWFGYGGNWYTSAMINNLAGNTRITNSTIGYSGERGVYSENTSPYFANNTIIGNATDGLYFKGLAEDRSFTFEKNIFIDNDNWAALAILDKTEASLFLNGNTSTGSLHNGFGLNGSIKGSVNYLGNVDTDFPFIITGDLTVPDSAALTIGPGTVFKFDSYYDDLYVYGNLQAKGTVDAPIVFTSLYDECYGGKSSKFDTIDAVPNQWAAIWFFAPTASGDLSNTVISYGGGAYSSANVNIYTDSVKIDSSIIYQSAENGIYISGGSPTITNNLINYNNQGIYLDGDAQPDIYNNSICNNNFGLHNASAVTVGAIDNWWGSSTGPLNTDSNPEGKGSQVSGKVDFYPWRINSIPSELVDIPSFNIVQYENKVILENTTVGGTDFYWTFGDDSSSTVKHPFHVYTNIGEYDICLTTKFCSVKQSFCKTILVKGIQSVSPEKGGNTGNVTIIVYGVGFTANSSFKLVNGSTQISSGNYNLTANGNLIATFDLNGAALGLYDVVVTIPGDQDYTKKDAFTIEQGTVAEPYVNIDGRPNALLGTWTKQKINIGNKGNTDAKGVPVMIAFPDLDGLEIDWGDLDLEFPDVDIKNPLPPGFQDEPCYYIVSSFMGIQQTMRIYTIYVPLLQALTVQTLDIKVKSEESYETYAYTGTSFFYNGFNDHYVHCFVDVFREFGYSQTIIDLITVDRLITFVEQITREEYQEEVVISCLGFYLEWAVSMVVENKLTYVEIQDIVQRFIEIYVDYYAYESVYEYCEDIIVPHIFFPFPVNIVTSFDPNEKKGPTGFTDDNYIAPARDVDYTVFFENKSDASAPAHTIIVKDSLDPNVFDLSSFEITSIVLGDSIWKPLPLTKRYINNLNIEHLNVDARILIELDDITGMLTTTIQSFNPETGEEVEDPFVGVLPPNVQSPEGEGSFSFRIKLKEAPVHNASFKNIATIYFDANEPIITNEYVNTFDMAPPLSEMDALDSESIGKEILLSWSGADQESGIHNYEIWVENKDNLYLWKTTKNTEEIFNADYGESYKFYCIATDNIGNKEVWPNEPDAETTCIVSTKDPAKGDKYILIQPNPARDFIKVEINTIDGKDIAFKIMDVYGRSLYKLESKHYNAGINKIRIDLSSFDNGLYYFVQKQNGLSTIKKFIIAK